MEQRSTPMAGNFVLFIVLSFAILFGYQALMQKMFPPAEDAQQQAQDDQEKKTKDGEKSKEGAKTKSGEAPKDPPKDPADSQPEPPGDGPPEDKPPKDGPPEDDPPGPVVAAKQVDRQWVTLGSVDPESPYRMLVTLDNRGAGVPRIELSRPQFRSLEDRSGYFGHVVMDPDLLSGEAGCTVQVVGPGTPAAVAGLQAGDVIVAVDAQKVLGYDDFQAALGQTKPKQEITLSVLRGGDPLELNATLGRRPLEVIKPEPDSLIACLLTLQTIDDRKLSADDNETIVAVGKELDGLGLWTSNWEVTKPSPTEVEFRRVLDDLGLEVVKRFRLEPTDGDAGAYHLDFDVQIRNIGAETRRVAYQLDGPNGLPSEGAWYTRKIGRKGLTGGKAGLRDMAVSFSGNEPVLIGCPYIAESDVDPPWGDREPLSYIGIDSLYFASVLLPQKPEGGENEVWVAQSQPLLQGEPDPRQLKLANTSCRVASRAYELAPGDEFSHSYQVFAGPKKPDVLAQYGLDDLVYYGWFWWLAQPMAKILHFFYGIVGNYGVAILMLTVLVRLCMFPLSRKQAMGMQKMQQLQPEMKKLAEKYKKDVQARTRAQQELFRKYNYNPLGGCVMPFLQLPIFIALYRSLMVDVELRQAPLLGDSIRWCSNLAAPDMLFRWDGFMPGFLVGWLGPYFNLLPIITVFLFLAQSKMFMPPPTDDQTAMQQKIMKYMMVFMGFIFFTVPSGLCIYFIASSMWGMAERKFLPKRALDAESTDAPTRADAKARAKSEAQVTRRKASSNGDGAAGRSKKKGSKGRR